MLPRFEPLVLSLSLLVAIVSPAAYADQRTFPHGATERAYELVGATPGTPRPLVLALHGNMGTGVQLARYADWPAVAARHGFVLALPDGLNRAWADGRPSDVTKGRRPPEGTDDVAFLTALVEHLVRAGIADRRKLYVAGVSNGGMMAMRLLCDRADLFAAGAAVIAVMTDAAAARCKPSRPVPIAFINGTRDRLIPYERAQPYIGTDATAAVFRRHNGCADKITTTALPDHEPKDGSTVARLDTACPAGGDVVVYRVDGGGHQSPSRRAGGLILEAVLGGRNRDIEAAEEIWSFVSRFTR